MSTSRLEHARPVRKKSLALGAMVLSISCLSLPALAEGPDSGARLPDAPSSRSRAVPVAFGAPPDHSLTFGERAHEYARTIFSPASILGPAFGAGIEQWDGEPKGWEQGAEGYGKRFGSAAARLAIAETIRFGFAAVDGEDPRYFRSENRGAWARTKHAVASTFVSKTSSGRTIPAFSRFAGIYSAAFISNTWYPDQRADARYAAERGSTALAGAVGFNILREFLPFFGGHGR